ncbi:hypothetical protein BJ165DRAFT_1598129 [Panaeolus papilionaceus]|nr:hypothetical protein BJ165DRAFT_1598129 [Panaeolus papilionaceus]
MCEAVSKDGGTGKRMNRKLRLVSQETKNIRTRITKAYDDEVFISAGALVAGALPNFAPPTLPGAHFELGRSIQMQYYTSTLMNPAKIRSNMVLFYLAHHDAVVTCGGKSHQTTLPRGHFVRIAPSFLAAFPMYAPFLRILTGVPARTARGGSPSILVDEFPIEDL